MLQSYLPHNVLPIATCLFVSAARIFKQRTYLGSFQSWLNSSAVRRRFREHWEGEKSGCTNEQHSVHATT